MLVHLEKKIKFNWEIVICQFVFYKQYKIKTSTTTETPSVFVNFNTVPKLELRAGRGTRISNLYHSAGVKNLSKEITMINNF